MREIKFRAWNTIKMIDLDPCDKKYDGALQDLVQEENWIVMQYTGLKDKNGKEIWEGDLCNYYGYIGVVKYDDECAMFFLDLSKNNEPSTALDPDCVVIGNIYESPELLEGV